MEKLIRIDKIHLPEKRTVLSYDSLAQIVEAFRLMAWTITVTIGTYDMLHVGHARYLERAAAEGDLLIVGIDSDAAVKRYKSPDRPIVPQSERLEMLLHTKYVDLVTVIDDVDETGCWQYGLLQAIRPDIFVATENSYPDDQIKEIEEYCGLVIVLPPQAETSTSEKIRQVMLNPARLLIEELRDMADRLESETRSK